MVDKIEPLVTPNAEVPKIVPSAVISPPSEESIRLAKKKRTKTLGLLTIFLLIAGLVWFLYWVMYLRDVEYTDDAYADGLMVTINAVVPGSVTAFYTDDTQLVQEGQLLVQLDAAPYRLEYERELASLAATLLQVKQLYGNVKVSQSLLQSRKIAYQNATYDYKNRSNLIESQAISNEEYTHAQNSLKTAEFDLQQATDQLQVALDAAGSTAIEEHPLLEQQKIRIKTAYYKLHHCAIYAPITGYVAQRKVEIGQQVSSNTSLMAIIPATYIWVNANFKETQLSLMRIGQPATVWFDLYGSKVAFRGQVLGIASGTGSIFSLIPPQNATGNWIKIVQRLPVRIGLDADQLANYPVRLGLSAEVNVDITNQQLPFLPLTSQRQVISATHIFDINFAEVDQKIDEILSLKVENQKIEN